MASNQETRSLAGSPPSVTGRKVTGIAAKFNSRSENMGSAASPVWEVISPGAFDGRLNDNCVALFNHDPNLILARSEGGRGTLRLWIDSVGLNYEFTAPNTQAGNDLLESIKRGDIRASSFSFSVAAGGDSYKAEGKAMVRTISKMGRLFDVSPVTTPAYQATTVSARSKPQALHPSVAHAFRRLRLFEK